jgi:hypothetical protein
MSSTLRIKKSLLIIILGGLTSFSCSLSDHNLTPQRASAAQLTSGVIGQMLRGPTHAGPPQAGDNLYIGFGALFYVYDDHGTLVTTFTSDSFGWFKVGLTPGQYTIAPDSSAPLLATGQTQQITVVKDKYSNVTLRFDSMG